MGTKKSWQSKTNWAGLIVAAAAFFPSVQALIAAHPDAFAQGLSAIFIGLRFISKGKIEIL